MDYKLAQELKDAGYPQHLDKLMSADEVRPTTAYVRFGHRTFDLSMLGYPKTNKDYYEQGKWRPSCIFSREYLESGEAETLYFPSLDELIKDFSNYTIFVYENGTVDIEDNDSPAGNNITVRGRNLEEAAAKFWIEKQNTM